jgi:hypothetical protein
MDSFLYGYRLKAAAGRAQAPQCMAAAGLNQCCQMETGFSPGRSDARDIDRLPAGAGGSKWQIKVSLFLY